MATVFKGPRSSSGPPRVALAVGPDTMHRYGRLIRHLVVGLLDAPFSVVVLAPETVDLSPLPCPPVELIQYPPARPGPFGRRFHESLAGQLQEREVEILHALDAASLGLIRRLSDIGDWPTLVTVSSLDEAARLGPLGRHNRGVVALSASIRAELLTRRAAAPEDVVVIRPGILQGRVVNCFAQPQRSAAILAAGRLDRPEPFLVMLDAFAALRQAEYDCAFFILGAGRGEHVLRTRAGSLGLMHDLTFIEAPPGDRGLSVFQSGDLLVYPRSQGSLEIEVLDAMAAGIPVLVGGECVGDFVIDQETALSYNALDAADLAARLRLLLDDHDLARRLARQALDHLREHHSPARMAEALAEHYRRHVLQARTLKIE